RTVVHFCKRNAGSTMRSMPEPNVRNLESPRLLWALNGTTAKYGVPAMAMPILDGGTRERLGGLLSPQKGGPLYLLFPLYALRNVRAIRAELITRRSDCL